MSLAAEKLSGGDTKVAGQKIAAILDELGPRFAARAADADAGDRFVAENFAELKRHGLMAAGVPAELGGLDASYPDLCEMLRLIAYHCGSTGLAFSMHTHQVATNAWRWRYQKAPVDGLLKRVVSESIVLLSSGGSDWLQGSGVATRVEGGYRINARKIFSSGAPAGDLLMTSAIFDDPEAGSTVLHFAVPMKAEGVKLLDTWRVLGMRGTGSHDVELADVFIADAAIGGKRPAGKWHPLFHIISMIALLQLRKKEPNLERPFKVPFYPAFPIIALVIASISFVAMTIYNLKLAGIYILIIGCCYILFKLLKRE